jgi:hypothetical protein
LRIADISHEESTKEEKVKLRIGTEMTADGCRQSSVCRHENIHRRGAKLTAKRGVPFVPNVPDVPIARDVGKRSLTAKRRGDENFYHEEHEGEKSAIRNPQSKILLRVLRALRGKFPNSAYSVPRR